MNHGSISTVDGSTLIFIAPLYLAFIPEATGKAAKQQ